MLSIKNSNTLQKNFQLKKMISHRENREVRQIFADNLQRALSFNNIVLPKLDKKPETIVNSPVLKSLENPIEDLWRIPRSPLLLPSIPFLSNSIKSSRKYGKIRGYCANTHKGLIRKSNEDRVMIISRLFPPAHRKEEKWPHCSFFAVYDGHGGKDCSSFLRDNLHNYLINDPAFPADPQTALLNAFATAEQEFTEQAIKKRIKSGSCALVLVLLDKIGVLANLGDSRCIVSESKSNKISQLSTEHTPEKESEELRIKKAGGEVYLETIGRKHISRVVPGNLSISRSIGDIDTKIYELGGIPDVIIAVPEIKIFKIHSDTDFILLGSDGIFERLDKREVVRIVAESAESFDGETHEKLAKGIENVIVESVNRGSEDNVTLLGIAFDNLDKLFQKQDTNYEL